MQTSELASVLSEEYLDESKFLELEGVTPETLENLKDNKGEDEE